MSLNLTQLKPYITQYIRNAVSTQKITGVIHADVDESIVDILIDHEQRLQNGGGGGSGTTGDHNWLLGLQGGDLGTSQFYHMTSSEYAKISGNTIPNTYSTKSSLSSHTGDSSIHFTKSSINLSDISNTAHTHTMSDIVSLQSELNKKACISGATFTGDIFAPNISATTFYGNGQYLTGVAKTDNYTTSAVLNGNTLVFNRTDSNSAYTVNLGSLSTTDNYTTGVTLNGNTLVFNRTDSASAYTVNLSGVSGTDNYTTGVTFVNNTLVFNRNDTPSAYTVDISKFASLSATTISATTFYGSGVGISGLVPYSGANSNINLNTRSIIHSGVTSGDAFIGDYIYRVAGETIAKGQLCKVGSAGKMVVSFPTAESLVPATHIAIESGVTDTTIGFMSLGGYVRVEAYSALTVGNSVYVSTLGYPTTTAPVSGEYVMRIGVADSTKSFDSQKVGMLLKLA